MAPEQIDEQFGEKNERTDIYALGALLYTILLHKRPFSGLSNDEIINATVNSQPKTPSSLNNEIAGSLSAICMKAMSREQKDRYQTVENLVKDVRAYQEGFATQAENASALKLLIKLLKRNKLLAVMVTLIIATGVLVGGISGRMMSKKEVASMRQILQEKEKSQRLHKMLQREKSKFVVDDSRLKTASSIRGQAIKLNGKNQGLHINNLNFSYGTIAFWFKPHKTGYDYPYFFQIGDTRWHINDRDDKTSGGLIVDGGKEELFPRFIGGQLWDRWHHFALTLSETGKLTFHIDGIELELKKLYIMGKKFSLGCWHETEVGKYANAYFDELSIWDKILSREEIIELANNKLTQRKPGLVAYFPFDGDTKDKVNERYNFEEEGNPVFLP